MNKICSCGQKHYAKGLCLQCYMKVWGASHKQRKQELMRRWHATHPEYKLWKKNYDRSHYLATRSEHLQQCHQWYLANKPKFKEYSSQSKFQKIRLASNKRRYHKMSWVKLYDNFFPDDVDIVWHHINDFFVVPIPTVTHNYYKHGKMRDIHRCRINAFIKRALLLDIDIILSGY